MSSTGCVPGGHGTHALRRRKAAQIYRKTGNLRAIRLLLCQAKVDSTGRYLGAEIEDALSTTETIDTRETDERHVQPFVFQGPSGRPNSRRVVRACRRLGQTRSGFAAQMHQRTQAIDFIH
jgi:hypothetical protein